MYVSMTMHYSERIQCVDAFVNYTNPANGERYPCDESCTPGTPNYGDSIGHDGASTSRFTIGSALAKGTAVPRNRPGWPVSDSNTMHGFEVYKVP
ncbi:hypothetical protein VNO77_27146 [Canavalia gladiata]|uniref:Uncharacterized protein n=1 Tax=Canavalia gladiata TaxID=3824 RepID=A0AAN9Q3Y1_CANGL